MDELRKLDEVAYVRYASVYRSFQDINAFQEEIDRLQRDNEQAADNKRQMSLLSRQNRGK